jgi:hypothetical protein
MLTDPQTITISGTTHTLPRVGISPGRVVNGITIGGASTYANSDETVVLSVTQSVTKIGRKRHDLKYVQSKVVTDPLSSANDTESTTLGFYIDRPGYGFTVADIEALVTGFKTALTSALVQSIYSGQS